MGNVKKDHGNRSKRWFSITGAWRGGNTLLKIDIGCAWTWKVAACSGVHFVFLFATLGSEPMVTIVDTYMVKADTLRKEIYVHQFI